MIDLDALERDINDPHSTGMLWKDVGLTLIQRLREADKAAGIAATFLVDLVQAEARIAQLELAVGEACDDLLHLGDLAVDKSLQIELQAIIEPLRAALAAVEEKNGG